MLLLRFSLPLAARMCCCSFCSLPLAASFIVVLPQAAIINDWGFVCLILWCRFSHGHVPNNKVCKTGHRVFISTKWSWGVTTGLTTLWRVALPKTVP